MKEDVFENIDLEMMCENSENPELTFAKIVANHPNVKVWPIYAKKYFDKWCKVGFPACNLSAPTGEGQALKEDSKI